MAIFPSYFGNSFDNGEREAIYDGSVSYIHFDAKYRVTDLSTLIGDTTASEIEEELDEEKVYEVINTYKRGDLLKMHTYNDAIRRTIGSYVLYPGNVDDKGTSFGLYDELLPGVGAFAIRPSIDAVGENELKNFITDLLESKSSINSRLNRMKHYMELVIKEPSINVKNVQTNNNGKDSECVVGYIRSGSDETYYEFLKSHCFLEEGKDFLVHSFAPENAWNSVFDLLYDFLKNNLRWNYIQGDPLVGKMITVLIARMNGASSDEEDLIISSSEYRIKIGAKRLIQNRPEYTEILFGNILDRMNELLHNQNPIQKTYVDQLVDSWFAKKISRMLEPEKKQLTSVSRKTTETALSYGKAWIQISTICLV